MGLDISFSKQQAVEAGLHLFVGEPNGCPQSVQEAEDNEDWGYAKWLGERPTLMDIPNTDHCVEYYESSGARSHPLLFIRANRWGNTFYPITEWLTSHNITWEES